MTLDQLKHERDLAWAMFQDVEQQVNELLLARQKARDRWCLLCDEIDRLESPPKMADLSRFVEHPLPTAEQLKAMLNGSLPNDGTQRTADWWREPR